MKIILTETQYKKLTNEQFLDKVKNFFTGGDEDKKEVQKTGCSTDTIKPKDWRDLYSKLVQNKMITQGQPLAIVWGPTQELFFTRDGQSVITPFKISTGANGFGNTEDDKKTPTGLMYISGGKVGQDYEVFVGKQGTGTKLGPNVDSQRIDDKTGKPHIAEVLTGFLDLKGLEKCNENVHSRNIYFHGTNREKFLGSPRSNGCIRMSTAGFKQFKSLVKIGETRVYVKP